MTGLRRAPSTRFRLVPAIKGRSEATPQCSLPLEKLLHCGHLAQDLMRGHWPALVQREESFAKGRFPAGKSCDFDCQSTDVLGVRNRSDPAHQTLQIVAGKRSFAQFEGRNSAAQLPAEVTSNHHVGSEAWSECVCAMGASL